MLRGRGPIGAIGGGGRGAAGGEQGEGEQARHGGEGIADGGAGGEAACMAGLRFSACAHVDARAPAK